MDDILSAGLTRKEKQEKIQTWIHEQKQRILKVFLDAGKIEDATIGDQFLAAGRELTKLKLSLTPQNQHLTKRVEIAVAKVIRKAVEYAEQSSKVK